jgi:hypothetical protein
MFQKLALSLGKVIQPNQLGPLKKVNLNSFFPKDPTDYVVWFHLMMEAEPMSETSNVSKLTDTRKNIHQFNDTPS